MSSEAAEITKMLGDIRAGDPAAADQLMEAVYAKLRGMAHRLFASERPDHTLQPTALVHEAYLRIFSGAEVAWRDRNHFYAIAAVQMRRVLVDFGREHRAAKRGCGLKVSFDEGHHAPLLANCDIELVDDLITHLRSQDGAAADVVEMKFFAGMTDREVADRIGWSQSTVRRHWVFAREWLVRQLDQAPAKKIAPKV
jgi:RNA polymerase sigma factor (TIGR02999 family)